MNRLVCVGEGHGEVQALPQLCHSIRNYLGVEDWLIDPESIRLSRSQLVGPSLGSRRQTRCNPRGVSRAIELARRRPRGADGVLVLCDADDDCPVEWGRSFASLGSFPMAVAGVMAVREYEAWLLWNIDEAELRNNGIADPEAKRNAKGAMRQFVIGYQPTTHQLQVTRTIDVPKVRAGSKSFDKLVRALAGIFGVVAPPRSIRPSARSTQRHR